MLLPALLSMLLLIAVVGALVAIGKGDPRRGRRRLIRRIRTVRRRRLRPVLARLKHAMDLAWTRPERSAVEFQIRRVADRIERASGAADRFAASEKELSKALSLMEELGPPSWSGSRSAQGPHGGHGEPASGRSREPWHGQGWVAALALALAGVAAAGANGWLLYEHLLPAVADLPLLPAGADALTVAAAFTVLPFLFGLVYFALTVAGRALGLRVLAAVVVLLVVGLTALEAGIVVLALEALGIAAPTWWGGIAVTALLAGSAALLPPTIAALAHASIDRLERWVAARERRMAGRSLNRQNRLTDELGSTMDDMRTAAESLRTEVLALGREPAGRLLLQPEARPTVDRAAAVLRRLARTVDRDVDEEMVTEETSASVLARVAGGLFALVVWFTAAAAALAIAAGGLRLGAAAGFTPAMTAAAFAAIAALLLGGIILRSIFAAPGARFGPGGRVVLVLLLGLATASLAVVLGPLMAAVEGSFFQERPLAAGAWLNLLVLVAAVASTHLGEGIGAAGAVLSWSLAAAGFAAMAMVDLGLAGLDRVLSGIRRSAQTAARVRGGRQRVTLGQNAGER